MSIGSGGTCSRVWFAKTFLTISIGKRASGKPIWIALGEASEDLVPEFETRPFQSSCEVPLWSKRDTKGKPCQFGSDSYFETRPHGFAPLLLLLASSMDQILTRSASLRP